MEITEKSLRNHIEEKNEILSYLTRILQYYAIYFMSEQAFATVSGYSFSTTRTDSILLKLYNSDETVWLPKRYVFSEDPFESIRTDYNHLDKITIQDEINDIETQLEQVKIHRLSVSQTQRHLETELQHKKELLNA